MRRGDYSWREQFYDVSQARPVDEALGVALFGRRRTDYMATLTGAEVIALAQRLEHNIVSVTRCVFGHDQEHAGSLRVKTQKRFRLGY